MQRIRTAGVIIDSIKTAMIHIGIIVAAAVHEVIALAADQGIISRAADQAIIPCAAIQRIIAGTADKGIITFVPIDNIVERSVIADARNIIRTRRTMRLVLHGLEVVGIAAESNIFESTRRILEVAQEGNRVRGIYLQSQIIRRRGITLERHIAEGPLTGHDNGISVAPVLDKRVMATTVVISVITIITDDIIIAIA